MAITENALGRSLGVAVTEGPRVAPLSEEQRRVVKIIKSSLPHALVPIGDGRPMIGPDAVFEAFSASDAFERIYSEAESEALFSSRSKSELDSRIKGAVIEELGKIYLGNQPHSGRVLLGGDIPHRVIHALNPEEEEYDNGFGQMGVAGRYESDVIEVEVGNNSRISVVGVDEISSSETSDKYYPQIHGTRKFLEELGSLAGDGGFINLVIPKFENRGYDTELSFPDEVEGLRVGIIRMPFTREECDRLFEDMTHFFRRTPEHPTIAELQEQGSERARKIRALGEPAFFRMRAEALSELDIAKAEAEIGKSDE